MTILGYSKYIIFLSLFVSCATGSKGRPLDYSMAEIRAAVEKKLPGPLHSVSVNGQVYQTKAFAVPIYYRKKLQKRGMPPRERAYAKITILGDMPPYTLAVEIEIEEIENPNSKRPSYVYCCRNLEFERDLAKEIHDYLVKRSKKRDLIDDYQAF